MKKKTIITSIKSNEKRLHIAIISLLIFSLFFAVVPLALAQPSLTLNPSSGPPGTVVAITGEDFAAGIYRVYFDSDGDAGYDSGEPYKTVSVGTPGTFTTTLTVPSVPSGTYYIRADVYPYTPPAVASAPFTVKTLWDQLWDKLLAIESEISAIEDKLKAIEDKLDDKPKIFEESVRLNLTFIGSHHIIVNSTEPFQVKAVYVDIDDPTPDPADPIDSYFDSAVLIMGPIEALYGFSIKHTPFDPAAGIPTLQNIEVLSYMDLWMYPAGSGGDTFIIRLLLSGTLSGDETIFVKVLVESAQDATVRLAVT